MSEPKNFAAGNVVLQSGMTFRDCRLSYQTYGELNADRSNVILFLTPFSANHVDIEWMVGPGRALNPERYFIVIPNMFGNGLSSSPSNAVIPFNNNRWPNFTIADNVKVQQLMLKEEFSVERVALACGWSMGGIQAYHGRLCFRIKWSGSLCCAERLKRRRTITSFWKALRLH